MMYMVSQKPPVFDSDSKLDDFKKLSSSKKDVLFISDEMLFLSSWPSGSGISARKLKKASSRFNGVACFGDTKRFLAAAKSVETFLQM